MREYLLNGRKYGCVIQKEWKRSPGPETNKSLGLVVVKLEGHQGQNGTKKKNWSERVKSQQGAG